MSTIEDELFKLEIDIAKEIKETLGCKLKVEIQLADQSQSASRPNATNSFCERQLFGRHLELRCNASDQAMKHIYMRQRQERFGDCGAIYYRCHANASNIILGYESKLWKALWFVFLGQFHTKKCNDYAICAESLRRANIDVLAEDRIEKYHKLYVRGQEIDETDGAEDSECYVAPCLLAACVATARSRLQSFLGENASGPVEMRRFSKEEFQEWVQRHTKRDASRLWNRNSIVAQIKDNMEKISQSLHEQGIIEKTFAGVDYVEAMDSISTKECDWDRHFEYQSLANAITVDPDHVQGIALHYAEQLKVVFPKLAGANGSQELIAAVLKRLAAVEKVAKRKDIRSEASATGNKIKLTKKHCIEIVERTGVGAEDLGLVRFEGATATMDDTEHMEYLNRVKEVLKDAIGNGSGK